MWAKLAALLAGICLLVACADGNSVEVRHVAVISDSFTSGSPQGGVGPHGWPALVRAALDRQNLRIDMRLAPESGAGYGEKGSHGGVFGDQVNSVVGIDTDLVVFFGSVVDAYLHCSDTGHQPVDVPRTRRSSYS